MNMRLVVRTNDPYAGSLNHKNLKFYVDGDAGPFRVTSQSDSTAWQVGSEETITWDVANTNDVNGVNCQAVDLVLYAYDHGKQGDIFVQKSPASRIDDLAQALIELFNSKSDIEVIGTRHGEKLYETLLNREEMAHAEDLGDYYRIPADNRDLNYKNYFIVGEQKISISEDYNSMNTELLNIKQIKEKLLTLDLVREELKG